MEDLDFEAWSTSGAFPMIAQVSWSSPGDSSTGPKRPAKEARAVIAGFGPLAAVGGSRRSAGRGATSSGMRLGDPSMLFELGRNVYHHLDVETRMDTLRTRIGGACRGASGTPALARPRSRSMGHHEPGRTAGTAVARLWEARSTKTSVGAGRRVKSPGAPRGLCSGMTEPGT